MFYVVAATVETGYPGVTAEIEGTVLLKADRIYNSSGFTHLEGITDFFFQCVQVSYVFIQVLSSLIICFTQNSVESQYGEEELNGLSL